MADRRRIPQVIGKPADQRRPAFAGALRHPGRRPPGRCPRPGLGGGSGPGEYPPSVCPACSGSFPAGMTTNPAATPAWGWPSARELWRPTAAAFGPRMKGRGLARRGSSFTIPGGGSGSGSGRTLQDGGRQVPGGGRRGPHPGGDDDPQTLRYVRRGALRRRLPAHCYRRPGGGDAPALGA